MLNGSGLNSVSLNGTTLAGLVLAGATFTVESTFGGEAVRQRNADAEFTANSLALFNSDAQQAAYWSRSASAGWFANATVEFAGRAEWDGRTTGLFLAGQRHEAAVDWNAGLDQAFFPDDSFAWGEWSAEATAEFDGSRITPIAGEWSITATVGTDSSLARVDRYAFADLTAGTHWSGDPSQTSDGVTTHSVAWRIEASSSWAVDNEKVIVIISDAQLRTESEFTGDAQKRQHLEGEWSAGIDWNITGHRTRLAQWTASSDSSLDILPELTQIIQTWWQFGGGTLQISAPHQTHSGGVEWTGTAEITGSYRLNLALAGEWTTESSLEMEGLRVRLATANWAPEVEWSARANVKRYAKAEWAGLGDSSFGGVAVLSLIPAPTHRHFKVPYTNRTFIVPKRFMNFKVAA